jgi:hypothetical protein
MSGPLPLGHPFVMCGHEGMCHLAFLDSCHQDTGHGYCGQPRAAHEPAEPPLVARNVNHRTGEVTEIPLGKAFLYTRHATNCAVLTKPFIENHPCDCGVRPAEPAPEPSVEALALVDQLCKRRMLPEATRLWAARSIEAWAEKLHLKIGFDEHRKVLERALAAEARAEKAEMALVEVEERGRKEGMKQTTIAAIDAAISVLRGKA